MRTLNATVALNFLGLLVYIITFVGKHAAERKSIINQTICCVAHSLLLEFPIFRYFVVLLTKALTIHPGPPQAARLPQLLGLLDQKCRHFGLCCTYRTRQVYLPNYQVKIMKYQICRMKIQKVTAGWPRTCVVRIRFGRPECTDCSM